MTHLVGEVGPSSVNRGQLDATIAQARRQRARLRVGCRQDPRQVQRFSSSACDRRHRRPLHAAFLCVGHERDPHHTKNSRLPPSGIVAAGSLLHGSDATTIGQNMSTIFALGLQRGLDSSEQLTAGPRPHTTWVSRQ